MKRRDRYFVFFLTKRGRAVWGLPTKTLAREFLGKLRKKTGKKSGYIYDARVSVKVRG